MFSWFYLNQPKIKNIINIDKNVSLQVNYTSFVAFNLLVSRYIPNHDKNFVNWSISIEENKPFHFDQPWILKKSLNNEIILDRRWEGKILF
jgi:hypothetical protein